MSFLQLLQHRFIQHKLYGRVADLWIIAGTINDTPLADEQSLHTYHDQCWEYTSPEAPKSSFIIDFLNLKVFNMQKNVTKSLTLCLTSTRKQNIKVINPNLWDIYEYWPGKDNKIKLHVQMIRTYFWYNVTTAIFTAFQLHIHYFQAPIQHY